MNEHDLFEQRLQQQPLRKVPPAWRTAILDAARNATPSQRSPAIAFPLLLWRELIWPCRRIWVGLAPVWVMLLAFNMTFVERRQVVTAEAKIPPAEIRLALQEQQRILDEIIGSKPPPSPAEPPRRPADQPRSDRRSVVAV